MGFWQEFRPTRPHQWEGSLTDIRTARFEGLVAYGEPFFVATAGAMAGAIMAVILLFLPLSPVRRRTFLFSVVFLAILGALLGLWRRHALINKKHYRLFNRDFLPHTLFTYVFIPFLPMLYMFILPDISEDVSSGLDTFTGGGILLLLMFWTGAVYDYLWETFHNFSLVRLSQKDPDHLHELTLRRWIMQEEALHQFRLDDVGCLNGHVVVKGRFEDPSELRRKLLLLDFVREATVIQQDEQSG
ncbi:MAG: hypothetical protein ACOYEP_05015 [Limnochordia bacterium]|jgi:hypothetical protein